MGYYGGHYVLPEVIYFSLKSGPKGKPSVKYALPVVPIRIETAHQLPQLTNDAAKLIDKIQAIDGTMTGRDNYEFYRSMNSQEFDISWNQGTRTFIQRGLYGDDEYDQKRRFGVSTS